MPVFASIYLCFILSNLGFPGTINFVGEFLILVGIFNSINIIVFLLLIGMILSLVYSLFLYNKIFFGPIPFFFLRYYSDITRLEFIILIIFLIFVILCGIYPNLIINSISISILKFIKFYI